MIHYLYKQNSLLTQFVAELRDVNIQKDRFRFRKNLERIGQVFAYEISKNITYSDCDVTTPMGIATCSLSNQKIVLATILRAGLPLHNGLLSFFDKADNAFVSAYRKHHKSGAFEINMQYITCPNIDDCVLIISDPMLATGASIQKSIDALLEYGKPKEIHVTVAIASTDGIRHIDRLYPDIHLWVAAEDEELTAKSYIVPGLGDAGDLSFGSKIQD
ncbi:MAG: uracil phosphoribosyltransferase [Saprospiraceae bacterium]